MISDKKLQVNRIYRDVERRAARASDSPCQCKMISANMIIVCDNCLKVLGKANMITNYDNRHEVLLPKT